MSLIGKIILYADIILFGLLCLMLWGWQLLVLRGRTMKNPDGSVDDWHDQKLVYGLALADVFLAVPFSLAGIVLIFLDRPLGYYLTGMASFWFFWINIVCTATSLRFHKPKITLNWIFVFPLGALVGLVYLIWFFVHFSEIS